MLDIHVRRALGLNERRQGRRLDETVILGDSKPYLVYRSEESQVAAPGRSGAPRAPTRTDVEGAVPSKAGRS